MAKQKVTATEFDLVQLDPAVVMADDNTRYDIKDIDSLAGSILAQGGVMVPVEVEPLTGAAANGYKYRLTYGFRRHAAVVKLNKEGAGLLLPAIVRTTSDPAGRLKRQIAENVERENMLPMDMCVAINKMRDAGVPEIEIRGIFSRPGGRKGNKKQPASNAFINMIASFERLPKGLQARLNSGTLTTTGAYELLKYPVEKWEAIIDKADKTIADLMAKDEVEEKKYLAQQAKAQKAETEKQEALGAVAKAEEEMNKTKEIADNRQKLAIAAYAKTTEGDPKVRKASVEAYKAADADYKAAVAVADKARKVWEKAKETHEKNEAAAAEHAAKLKQARTAITGKKKEAVSGTDVQKAAMATGEAATPVPLTAKECRDAVHDLTLPGGNRKVIAVGLSLEKCFLGQIGPESMYKEVSKIVS